MANISNNPYEDYFSNHCLTFVKLLFDNLVANVYCLENHKSFGVLLNNSFVFNELSSKVYFSDGQFVVGRNEALTNYLNMSDEINAILCVSQTVLALENFDTNDEVAAPIDVIEQQFFEAPFRQMA